MLFLSLTITVLLISSHCSNLTISLSPVGGEIFLTPEGDKSVCCSSSRIPLRSKSIQRSSKDYGTPQRTAAAVDDEDDDYDDDDDDKKIDHIKILIRYKHTQRRLPQCLIVGARKAGTRALLEFLNLHPSIQAYKQEMHFFDDDRNYSMGLDWYRHQMPYSFADQITIEKTPAYFVAERVPARVQAMNSSIKLLLIVRDPVERAVSDFMQLNTARIQRGMYHEASRHFEELAINWKTGEVNESYRAIRRSVYHRYLSRWLRHFTIDQFHIVNGEQLVDQPVDELRKIEEFLGIEHRLNDGLFYFNSTRGFYCMHVDKVERCLASSKGRQHPNLNGTVVDKLRRYFRPHNYKLYAMVGIDFGWSNGSDD